MATTVPATPKDVNPITGRVENEIDKVFRQLIKHGGSDLHMQVGKAPILRVKGTLRELQMEPIDRDQMMALFMPMMDERNQKIFHEEGGADFSYVVEHEGEPWRFRVNLFIQLGFPGMVSRKIERSIPNFDGLYLPPVMESLCKFDQGMVLLAGVTGSGKSTTIASMLNWVNDHYRKHILTIEDPIEFVYTQNKCLINQREVGIDVKDFEIAMKHAVRQDPDIMLVGEMRDMETFSTAIHAAETGHLVFGTIHASNAPSCIGRILDLFPQDMHKALRGSLAFNMRAIVAQKLLKTIVDKPGRVPIVEIMTFNPTVRKLVLEEHDEKLSAAIRIGKDEGMQQFNDSLKGFIDREFISRADAFEISPNVEELKMVLKGIDVKGAAIL
ncbi:PilT/PilU family type 4a pilus ATPase [Gimesia sp.]|uniref:type IV pilus twitching motility protein PilT n=1 Tax=Gimesia sp. TaxID=2024833 RepID=UPI000C4D3617|nr:PilT/PilU family type 4a pilus ATPase [Gimesia sp.]MAX37460.1 twitching motility protein PilT [Gimesia sp.]HAH44692.1 twitching motility protein PilT [Planctomycetaceae bacterium]HBL47144.1 twitching motility protein PilT [Planctomycetaceae bacterium]|tara:strand:+ start:13881 stop:15035 length:1155 start_codon:yes stop_codon:yes gene_type:complete